MTRGERILATGAALTAAIVLGLALALWAERGPALLIGLWAALCA